MTPWWMLDQLILPMLVMTSMSVLLWYMTRVHMSSHWSCCHRYNDVWQLLEIVRIILSYPTVHNNVHVCQWCDSDQTTDQILLLVVVGCCGVVVVICVWVTQLHITITHTLKLMCNASEASIAYCKIHRQGDILNHFLFIFLLGFYH